MKLEESENYVTLLSLLAEASGMIAPSSKRKSEEGLKRRFYLTDTVTTLLAQPPDVVQATMLRTWIELQDWDDLADDPLVREQTHLERSATDQRRRKLLNSILTVKPGEAIQLKLLYDGLAYFSPSAFLPNSDFGESRDEIRRGIETLSANYLYRFGITEISDAGNGNVLVRPTSDAHMLMRRALGLEERSPDIPVDENTYDTNIVVQPNLEIVVNQHIHPLILLTLCEFSRIQSNQQAIVLKISRDSIRGALDAGMSGEQIIAFLEKHSVSGVPQNLRYTIGETADKYGLIRLGTCECYFVVKDEQLMQEIRANPKLSEYLTANLSKDVAVLEKDRYSSFLKDLRKAGYLPVDETETAVPMADKWQTAVSKPPKPSHKPKSAETTPARASSLEVDWDVIASEDGQPYVKSGGVPESRSNKLKQRRMFFAD
jgi:hypothetical protein